MSISGQLALVGPPCCPSSSHPRKTFSHSRDSRSHSCPPAGLRPGVGCQHCQHIPTSPIQGNQKHLPRSSGTGMETGCWATQLSCTTLPPYLGLSQHAWMVEGQRQMRGQTCAKAASRGGWRTAKSRGSGSPPGKARAALAHALHVAKLLVRKKEEDSQGE